MFEISPHFWPIGPTIFSSCVCLRHTGDPRAAAGLVPSGTLGQWANLFFLFQTFHKIKLKTGEGKMKSRK